MILTGRQIREARTLLKLNRSVLAQKVGRITTLAIMRAEEDEDALILTLEQAAVVRHTLERLGVDFTAGGPQLRKSSP